MTSITATVTDELRPSLSLPEPSLSVTASAVSWGAIAAGAAAAVALSLILLILGTGLGLSVVSPWSSEGISAKSFGISTILWITFTQLAASGLGGYLAGRLRTRWIAVHTDEVYFRDTAHGFLAWSIATLVTAALLTTTISAILSNGVQASAVAAGSIAASTNSAIAVNDTARTAIYNQYGTERSSERDSGLSGYSPLSYFVDSLFRRDLSTGNVVSGNTTSGTQDNRTFFGAVPQTNNASNIEVSRIFMAGIQAGTLSETDIRYVGQVVAQRTGLSQEEAEKRVRDTYANWQARLNQIETAAKDAADKARKTSAYTALWLCLSLFIGAFIASLTAIYGGRRRDA